jgi:hypothetical protein
MSPRMGCFWTRRIVIELVVSRGLDFPPELG